MCCPNTTGHQVAHSFCQNGIIQYPTSCNPETNSILTDIYLFSKRLIRNSIPVYTKPKTIERLDRPSSFDKYGNRHYYKQQVRPEDLEKIEIAILNGLGLGKFIPSTNFFDDIPF